MAEERERDGRRKRPLWRRFGRAGVGAVFAFLALAGYFVWLGTAMGGQAPTGAGPLVAVFIAAGLGIAAAGLALVAARRERGK